MGMKKIIRNIFIGIFVVIIVAIAGVASFLLIEREEPDVRVTVKAPDGKSYVVKEEDGTKYAVVKDASGKIWGAEIKDDGSIGETKADLSGKVSDNDVISNYDGPDINITNNVEYTGQVSEVTTAQATDPNNPTQEDNTTVPEDQTPRLKRYIDIFASNNYLMEFTTTDETLGNTPITAAAKNGNIIIDTVMPYDENTNLVCKMLYLADKDKTYLIIDNFRKYCSIPTDLMGEDFNMSDMNIGSNFGSSIDLSKIKQSTVTIDGKEFHCESSKSKNSEVKYYFDGDTLVRFDTIDKDGNVVTTNFKRITSDVPDSTFEIPSNYGYINLSWLGFLGGKS